EELGDHPPATAVFTSLPYSGVFPRAAAIVHSSGIGTLAQALAAGQPQLIVPVAFDQPDNARRTVALGVARSIPFREASAAAMTRELALLLDSADYAGRAEAIARAVRSEDAIGTACDALVTVRA